MRSVLVWEEFQFSVPPSGQGHFSATPYSLFTVMTITAAVMSAQHPGQKKKKKKAIFSVSH